MEYMDETVKWEGEISEIPPVSWICAYCDSRVAANSGYSGHHEGFHSSIAPHYVVFCPGCGNPTHLISPGTSSASQIPEPYYGVDVDHIRDKDLKALYGEARAALSNRAYTATVLCCRKILMHVAVDLGAEKGKTFAFYVDYLKDNHHITPASEGWVRAIKDRGNEQNHEIRVASRDEAKDTVDFCAMLLQTIYEYPARAQRNRCHAFGEKNSTPVPHQGQVQAHFCL